MSTGVVMILKIKKILSDEYLRGLRIRFLNEMKLKAEDFYNDGVLVKVTNKNYEMIPKDEQESMWLDLNFHRAFFEIGYERGDLSLYINTADWLEKELPDCHIYYGHDSNDKSIALFDSQKRQTLTDHRNNLNNLEN
jgi:hypothetical protein